MHQLQSGIQQYWYPQRKKIKTKLRREIRPPNQNPPSQILHRWTLRMWEQIQQVQRKGRKPQAPIKVKICYSLASNLLPVSWSPLYHFTVSTGMWPKPLPAPFVNPTTRSIATNKTEYSYNPLKSLLLTHNKWKKNVLKGSPPNLKEGCPPLLVHQWATKQYHRYYQNSSSKKSVVPVERAAH